MAAMSGSSKNDALYISLLGLAENFRVSNPPNIRLCIHCLQSIFNINPPPLIVSRTHLQLGNILLAHTKNKELATRHLEQAVSQICIANLSFVQIGPDIFFFYFCIFCSVIKLIERIFSNCQKHAVSYKFWQVSN